MTTKTISYLRLLKPDIVVSVHPLMNHLGINWIKEANLEVPFVTIVTDMVTIHPLWICPSVTKCLVPTTQAQKSAVEFGMPKEKTEVCGHPVRRGFFTAVTDKNTLRQELGIEPTKPVVMIMGGGEGSGPIYETVHALAQIKPEIQMLVITGRNKRLKEKLAAITKKTSVRLYSFVQNIPELMYASDILITKAGPSTISEALVVGLPLIIFNHIPVQEIGNVTYLLENRAGVYAKDSFQIADLVQEYIYSIENSRLQQTVYNASKLSKPLASVTIANRICSLI